MFKHKTEIDLGGLWRFRTDPEKLGEHFSQQLDIPWQFDARWMRRAYDDSAWSEIRVPSCWQAEGVRYNGVAWYRKDLSEIPGDARASRLWLRFEGVDYYADVWINEHYLGSHEGYFAAFQHEITPYLDPENNILAVRVDSPSDICTKEAQTGQLKGLIKGALQRWDVNNPDINPGGIWHDVKLIATGPGAISRARIHTQIARLPHGPDNPVPCMVLAEVGLAGFPPDSQAEGARIRATLAPDGFDGMSAEAVLPIEILTSPSVWQVPIRLDEAYLWNTWDIGTPNLYRLKIVLDVDGVPSDEITQICGFRSIERAEGWQTFLNGHRIFQRGANYLSDQLLSEMTLERYTKDVQLLREANLNTVHPFCVVEKQSFYDLCDRYGILVYQDFPMWLMMDNSSDLVRRATTQMEELILQFAHHPSIGIWNCGSQPSVANFEKLGSALAKTAAQLDPTGIVQQSNALVDLDTEDELPDDPVGKFHWTELQVRDFQERFDWRMDTHQYRGWYSKRMEDLRSVPRDHLQLVTEYGAQALPSRRMMEQIIPQEGLFPPDWSHYTRRCFQPEYQFLFIEGPQSLEGFISDSQGYQARFIQFHTEHYRRHKFNPCNGAHLFCFNDCWPAITWSVVDYDREPKEGFFALQRAMAPLQALLEFEERLCAGVETTTQVWIVNDYPRAFDDLEVLWEIVDDSDGDNLIGGELVGAVSENDLESIGTVRWTPQTVGTFAVHLRLIRNEVTVAENHYQVKVIDP
jgi:beta-mannosidase